MTTEPDTSGKPPPAGTDARRTRVRRALRARGIRLLRVIRRAQDRLAHLLGSSVEGRAAVVARMLARNANEATSYWLQLGVSIGIATLGLVVGSAAVIIGAMLIAPLMGPIIALAMGLAAGSPFLVLRAAARIILSVVVAVGGAALITLLLPFHEVNAEIGARTAPTVLDLLTAGFCALAAVYASLRPGSDTATTAAGTAIGISLVPPLCASGFGLGTESWSVAGGAALLFLTNLVAIIVVGTTSFVAAGFNRVDTTGLEREELARNQDSLVTAAIARRLAGLFESKAGPVLRFLMPLVLLATVYVPLRRALDEVAWEVRVRAAVQDSLRREPHKVVESRVRVERHAVDLLIVLLGTTADADASRARLDAEIEAVAGVEPRIEVLAIPDADALAGLESSLRTQEPLRLLPAPAPPTPAEQLEAGREVVRSSVAGVWPGATAGEPLAIDVGVTAGGPLRIRVAHLGAALSVDAIESLGRALGTTLAREVQLIDVAIPTLRLSRAAGDLAFLAAVAAAVPASTAGEINVCVERPDPARIARRDRELGEAVLLVLARHPRVTYAPGADWTVRFTLTSCTDADRPTPSATAR